MSRQRVIKCGSPKSENTSAEIRIESSSRVMLPEKPGSPIIECKMDENIVRSIVIECGCGQKTEIFCQYDD